MCGAFFIGGLARGSVQKVMGEHVVYATDAGDEKHNRPWNNKSECDCVDCVIILELAEFEDGSADAIDPEKSNEHGEGRCYPLEPCISR